MFNVILVLNHSSKCTRSGKDEQWPWVEVNLSDIYKK